MLTYLLLQEDFIHVLVLFIQLSQLVWGHLTQFKEIHVLFFKTIISTLATAVVDELESN